MVFGCRFFLHIPDVILDSLVGKNHCIFFRKSFQLYDQLTGMNHVDQKNAKEHSDEKGKRQIPGEPIKSLQDVRVDEKIVYCTQYRPGS